MLLVTEMATASQEQSGGLDHTNRAVTQIDRIVQTGAAQTEELMSTAEVLAEQSRQLEGFVGRFKLAADRQRPVPPKLDRPYPVRAAEFEEI